MRTLLSALVAGLFVLASAPKAALACHQGTPHDNETSCDGAGASGVIQFVGFTDDVTNALADTINGGQGMLEMNALCQDDFGPEARMCLDREFWLSPNAEAPTTSAAWLHETVGTTNTGFIGIGRSTSCAGWSSGVTGSVVTATGLADNNASCVILRPVTCCAPAQ